MGLQFFFTGKTYSVFQGQPAVIVSSPFFKTDFRVLSSRAQNSFDLVSKLMGIAHAPDTYNHSSVNPIFLSHKTASLIQFQLSKFLG